MVVFGEATKGVLDVISCGGGRLQAKDMQWAEILQYIDTMNSSWPAAASLRLGNTHPLAVELLPVGLGLEINVAACHRQVELARLAQLLGAAP
jgi:hypothetical protein